MVKVGWLRAASAPAKNVAKTLEILTFSKRVMPWLLNGASSTNAAAATATYFLENLLKPLKYCYFLVEISDNLLFLR